MSCPLIIVVLVPKQIYLTPSHSNDPKGFRVEREWPSTHKQF